MYDKDKIIPGLIIFFFLITFPFWYNLGQAAYESPKPKLPVNVKKCIEDTEWMRANHMELLNEWRDMVVRHDMTHYVNSAGVNYEISLQKTCMKCHTSKKEFCDKCHVKVSVSPYCWDCHVAPEEVTNGQ